MKKDTIIACHIAQIQALKEENSGLVSAIRKLKRAGRARGGDFTKETRQQAEKEMGCTCDACCQTVERKYETCPKCKANAVHLALATVYHFYGDEDDQEGNASEYESEEAPNAQIEVSLFAHICMECGHLVDVGIESPREKAVNTSTRKIDMELSNAPICKLVSTPLCPFRP